MHAHAFKQYIFRSYNKSDFNIVRFMKIHLHANAEEKKKEKKKEEKKEERIV